MGDSDSETVQPSQSRQLDDEKNSREHFPGGPTTLNLHEESIAWIMNHIDCFAFNANDDEVWDKVGQAIGHLQAPGKLHI